MIIYIHGFGGSGKGVKAIQFKKYYKQKNMGFLAPSLSYVPTLALSTLEGIIENCKDREIKLIGSSLGGFYAIYLANKYNLKTALINPSTNPILTLQRIKEENNRGINFFDLSEFDFTSNHINMLEKYYVKDIKKELFLVMLQKDDTLIDYQIAKKLFDGSNMIIGDGGGHGFEGIESYFEEIDSFFTLSPPFVGIRTIV
jgi:predicted esterase YcpF (UPF0227 family)